MHWYLVTLMTVLLFHTSSGNCARRRLINTIKYDNCHPKRILTYGCMGSCLSYAQPSASQKNHLEHFCQCCQEEDKIEARVGLLCPNPGGRRRFKRIVFRVTIPRNCSCRPCSLTPFEINRPEPDFMINK